MFSPDFHALGFDFPEWENLVDAMIAAINSAND